MSRCINSSYSIAKLGLTKESTVSNTTCISLQILHCVGWHSGMSSTLSVLHDIFSHFIGEQKDWLKRNVK